MSSRHWLNRVSSGEAGATCSCDSMPDCPRKNTGLDQVVLWRE
jgi:hypothetical protein